MTDHLRELDTLLNVDPSPAFVARVRERIASEPAPASRLLAMSQWLVPALAAAAALVVFAVVRQPSPIEDPIVMTENGSDVALPAPAPAPDSVNAPAIVALPALSSRARGASARTGAPAVSEPVHDDTAGSLPVVLMAADESAALRRLVTRFSARGGSDAPVTVAPAVFTGQLELDDVRVAALTDLPPIVIDVLPVLENKEFSRCASIPRSSPLHWPCRSLRRLSERRRRPRLPARRP